MKRLIVTFMFIVIFFPCAVMAQDQDFGLGVIIGEPTGVSFKKWTGNTTAIDGAVAWSFSGQDALHLHTDYLIHNFDMITVERGRLPVYFGLGARLKLEDRTIFSVRIPVGVCYLFDKAPLDIFFELVPMFDLVPDTDFKLSGSIGIRYYF